MRPAALCTLRSPHHTSERATLKQATPPSCRGGRGNPRPLPAARAVCSREGEEGEEGGGVGKEGCPGEEEDGTEFVDNDAYITFSPAPAKFQIVREEKGNVFETVRVREEVYVADS